MDDTRLNQVAALVEDARAVLADIKADCDGLPAHQRIALEHIRIVLNEALRRTQTLKDAS